jgi:F-type H+-transporting ATPase subunit a
MSLGPFLLAAARQSASPLEHVLQHAHVTREVHLGSLHFEVTLLSDHILMILLAGLLLALLLPSLVRRRRGGDEVGRLVPAGPANFIETICEYLRKEVAEPSLHEHTDRFIKFVWTLFFFILTLNLLGLLPLGPISNLLGTHVGGTATANIWVTGALATMTLSVWVVNGIRLGGKQFFAHFCQGPLWLAPLLIPLEVVGLVAKAFALAVRLFANMLAGHVLLAVLIGFILSVGTASGWLAGLGIAVPVVVGSVAISLLEIFVALLQAFIFTFLATLFLGQSVVFHHGEAHAGTPAH